MDRSALALPSVLEASPEEASIDDVYAALANESRRKLLVVLSRAQTAEPLSALTRNLAVEMNRSGDDAVKRLYTYLYHCHLPKLVSSGLVEHNENRETVGLTEPGQKVARALDQKPV